MTWTTIHLDGKPADLFTPANSAAPKPAVFLHGYDGVTLKDNPGYTAEFDRHGLQAICPHGPRCWWTDVVDPNFDPVLSPVAFLAREIPRFFTESRGQTPAAIGVFGIEMGGQGALQLAYRHSRQFPVVAAISPKVNFEEWHGHGTSLDAIFPDAEAARQATAILHIHPLNWPKHQLLLCDPADMYCRDGVETLASKLSSSGIPFEDDFRTSHGGYGWPYANAMAGRVVEYLAGHLS